MSEDFGTPFAGSLDEPIDEWSRLVFETCRDWPRAVAGRWYRSDGGWIMLRIEEADGKPLEPLFAIEMDTARDQLNLDFGSWATPILPPNITHTSAAARAAVAEARTLIEGWLQGQVKIAVYSDQSGWRGGKIIDGEDLPAAIEPVPVHIGRAGSVIVKASRRDEWRSWRQMEDGTWSECKEESQLGDC